MDRSVGMMLYAMLAGHHVTVSVESEVDAPEHTVPVIAPREVLSPDRMESNVYVPGTSASVFALRGFV